MKKNPNVEMPTTGKVYIARLTQSGTGAPQVAGLVKNTLGDEVVWTRTGTGFYLMTLPITNTVLSGQWSFTWGLDRAGWLTGEKFDVNVFRVRSLDSTGAGADGMMFNATVHILITN